MRRLIGNLLRGIAEIVDAQKKTIVINPPVDTSRRLTPSELRTFIDRADKLDQSEEFADRMLNTFLKTTHPTMTHQEN